MCENKDNYFYTFFMMLAGISFRAVALNLPIYPITLIILSLTSFLSKFTIEGFSDALTRNFLYLWGETFYKRGSCTCEMLVKYFSYLTLSITYRVTLSPILDLFLVLAELSLFTVCQIVLEFPLFSRIDCL